jgi:hypothetical protein
MTCGIFLACFFSALAAEPFAINASAPKSQVVIVQNDMATEAFSPHLEVIQTMVERGITNITGKITPREAWLSLVNTQDVVGIKVYSAPGPNSGTRPAVVEAVALGLLDAGLPPRNIVIWDKSETDLRIAGFFALAKRLGVRCMGSARAGYDEKVYYDTALIGQLIWGDLEFEKKEEGIGRRSFVSKLLTKDITKLINVTPLLNHNLAGVSGALYGMTIGSVDNTRRFESEPTRLARCVPEIYAMPEFSDRVVMNITDALVCQYEGGERGLLHYSSVLNELRFSRDPVALDSLSIAELERLRKAAGAQAPKPNTELYQNAMLMELGVSDVAKIQVERVQASNR